jgi:cytochrome c551/c552
MNRKFFVLAIASAALAVAASAQAAELMPAVQQTALVQKYCAVCHTDQVKNGGLSLQHYDAAQADPALAAMLLSKLRNGAMGAAGLGVPDKATQEAWVAATTAQAERSRNWNVTRTADLTASIVRDVAPRKPGEDSPLYRLTVDCNTATHQGDFQLSWSPAPQTNRIFSVSTDGNAAIPYKLEGQEKMGNGSAGASGLAAAKLNGPLPQKTLSVTDLFPGETVVFPLDNLDRTVRQQLVGCFSASSRN